MARKYCGNSQEVSIECPLGYIPCCVVRGMETHTSCLTGSPDPTGPGGHPNSPAPKFGVMEFTDSLINLLLSLDSLPKNTSQFIRDLRKALTEESYGLYLKDVSLVFHPSEEMVASITDLWDSSEMENIWTQKINSLEPLDKRIIKGIEFGRTVNKLNIKGEESKKREM